MEEIIKSIINKQEEVYREKLEEAISIAQNLQVNPIKNTKLLAAYIMALLNISQNHPKAIEIMNTLESIILSNPNYILKTSGGYFFKLTK